MTKEKKEVDLIKNSTMSTDISISDSLIENFPTPFFTVDQEMVVTRMNKPLEVLSGYDRNEVVGKMKCSELLSTKECDTAECLLKQSMTKHTPIAGIKKTFKNRRGEEIPIVVNASVITDQSGRVRGGFEAFEDISEIERAQKEIEETRFLLLQTEKAGAVGRFAAGLAHEINNPITGILSYCDLVVKEIGDDHRLRNDMEQIIEQALRCKNILSNLTILSQKSLIIKGIVDINENINACIQNCRHYTLSGNITLTPDLGEGVPPVRGDQKLISLLFHNLLGNAIDSLNGDGSVIASSRFDPHAGEVVIEVRDTGCGIPDEEKSRVFEPFHTTKPSGQGSGLGLAIVHEIVARHGGSIGIEDISSGGTIFAIRLPLETPMEEPGTDL